MKYILLIFGIIFFAIKLNAKKNDYSKEVQAYIDSKNYYAPGYGNYIEFQIKFIGNSLNYVKNKSGFSAEVLIQMEIKKQDSIIISDAYRLSSPLFKDSITYDFYDIKRFILKPGLYNFKIKILDLNNDKKKKALEANKNIIIQEIGNDITISDIQIAQSASKTLNESSIFYKSGYEIIPYLSTFYPKEISFIPVYLEIYNTNKLENDVFAIKQILINSETKLELQELTTFSKHDTANVVVFMREIDITDIPTGKYTLQYTVLNKNMTELYSQSYEFDRSNNIKVNYQSSEIILDPSFKNSIKNDSLNFYIESLIPISTRSDINNILKITNQKNIDLKRRYHQKYWKKTSPKNTYENWIKYKKQVDFVEKIYSTNIQCGYETDRGRTYLKYGSPSNVIQREYSPTEYPYEIWIYDNIKTFTNKRFVFYNPSMANNSYQLLHSDMIGEIQNLNWPSEISKNGRINNPNSKGDYGGSAGRDY